jgi:ferric-dicitrate binding protein FerR (iron transport regulator)
MSNSYDERMMRYLDGQLSASEVRELSARLRDDPAARAALRDVAEQAQLMADLSRETSTSYSPPTSAVVAVSRVRAWRRLALSCAAALLLLVGAVATWIVASRQQPVLRLVQASGEVCWTGDDGRMQNAVPLSTWLYAGDITDCGETASAEFQFVDGTSVTLLGSSHLAVADNTQKKLNLRRGLMSAQVTPQPAKCPMIVRTPTAEIEIVGTVFSLAAEDSKTALTVGSGRVRMRRLADGQVVEVRKGHSARVTSEVADELRSRPQEQPTGPWLQNFQEPPPPSWAGSWKPPSGNEPGRLASVPLVAREKKDGMQIIHYGVKLRGIEPALAIVQPDSIFRLRWRMQRQRVVFAMLSVCYPDGRFANNFQTHIQPTDGEVDASGWRTIALPLSSFEPFRGRCSEPPERGRLFLLFITSCESRAGMEIAEVGIAPPSRGMPPP